MCQSRNDIRSKGPREPARDVRKPERDQAKEKLWLMGYQTQYRAVITIVEIALLRQFSFNFNPPLSLPLWARLIIICDDLCARVHFTSRWHLQHTFSWWSRWGFFTTISELRLARP